MSAVERLTVRVKPPTGSIVSLTMRSDDAVLALKKRIFGETRVPIVDQVGTGHIADAVYTSIVYG